MIFEGHEKPRKVYARESNQFEFCFFFGGCLNGSLMKIIQCSHEKERQKPIQKTMEAKFKINWSRTQRDRDETKIYAFVV